MKKAFQPPELNVSQLNLADVITNSNYDLPFVPANPTPEPTGWETPIYP